MKRIMLISCFAIFPALLFAQAQIDFDHSTIDYEHIKVGSNGQRSFNFSNTGDRPLQISRVVSTSSHLKVIYPERSIEPGNTAEILVTYDTDVPGPIRRTITIYSNAKNQPIVAVKVKGYVEETKSSEK